MDETRAQRNWRLVAVACGAALAGTAGGLNGWQLTRSAFESPAFAPAGWQRLGAPRLAPRPAAGRVGAESWLSDTQTKRPATAL